MKKLISAFLAIILLFGCFTGTALAAEDFANWDNTDPRWENYKIGTNAGTHMGAIGCRVVSISIVAAKLGLVDDSFTPLTLAQGLKAMNGFASSGGMNNWTDCEKVIPGLQMVKKVDLRGKDGKNTAAEKAAIIAQYAANGYACTICVANGGHYVAANYVEGNTVYIHDPGNSTVSTLSYYSNSGVSSIRVFRRTDGGIGNTNAHLAPQSPAPNACRHEAYNSYGKCKNCKADYPISLSGMAPTVFQTVKDNVPVRNRPYSPEKIINYLPKGTKVTVVASGNNSIENLWYQLQDGTWIYNKNLCKVVAVPEAVCLHSSYNDKGYCTKCGKEFSMELVSMNATYRTIKDDVPVRNRPYAPEAIIRTLANGTKVKVVSMGKNSQGNTWFELSDNTWVFSGNLEKVKVCSHSYGDTGYCTKCKQEFPISLTPVNAVYKTVKKDVPVRNRPYAPEKSVATLAKGAKVTVVASGNNSQGNLWYKLSDNTWVFSGNVEKVSSESPIKFSLTTFPNGTLPYGKDFALKGKITSTSALVEVKAYLMDGGGKVLMEAKGSSTSKNYIIEGYALDKGMKFNKLAPGSYYLKYTVKDKNGNTATWVSNLFKIAK